MIYRWLLADKGSATGTPKRTCMTETQTDHVNHSFECGYIGGHCIDHTKWICSFIFCHCDFPLAVVVCRLFFRWLRGKKRRNDNFLLPQVNEFLNLLYTFWVGFGFCFFVVDLSSYFSWDFLFISDWLKPFSCLSCIDRAQHCCICSASTEKKRVWFTVRHK